jgi:hypothetical protein
MMRFAIPLWDSGIGKREQFSEYLLSGLRSVNSIQLFRNVETVKRVSELLTRFCPERIRKVLLWYKHTKFANDSVYFLKFDKAHVMETPENCVESPTASIAFPRSRPSFSHSASFSLFFLAFCCCHFRYEWLIGADSPMTID